jgi:hypothetical protein
MTKAGGPSRAWIPFSNGSDGKHEGSKTSAELLRAAKSDKGADIVMESLHS